jgi:two-component system phosphate regulon response regulator PhoB
MVTDTRGARILVVEDEPDVGEVLEHILKRERFEPTVCRSAEESLRSCQERQPDLVLLDLSLPDLDGLEILKSLKRSPETADIRVIIVTARESEMDRILGLELGADDYVSKPFSPRELVLRVRAVLDRGRMLPSGEGQAITAGPIEVDMDRHEARVQGDPLQLTLTEFKLLSELVRARGRVRSRESLLQNVWGYTSDVMSRTVDTHVRRLRSKLGPAASWISTVRGVGYRIEDPARDR